MTVLNVDFYHNYLEKRVVVSKTVLDFVRDAKRGAEPEEDYPRRFFWNIVHAELYGQSAN